MAQLSSTQIHGDLYISNNFKINSNVLVTNLNADLLDGLHASSFAKTTDITEINQKLGERYGNDLFGNDVNNWKTFGSYGCIDGSTINLPANKSWGNILVYRSMNDRVIQIYNRWNSTNAEIYIRQLDSTTWGSWKKIYHEGSKPTPAEIGAVSLSDVSPSSIANKVVQRDGANDIHCRLLRSNYLNQPVIDGAIAYRNNDTNDNYLRFCSDTNSIRNWIGALSTSGGDVTGNIRIGQFKDNNTGIYSGNGDGAGIGTITNNISSGVSNLILQSWNGIGFANSCSSGGPTGVNVAIDCRAGSIDARGNITAKGTIKATKVYNAVYNDYAEWFEKENIEEMFEPGDVVVWDENGVTKSKTKNDTSVVGVYSDSYGHIVGGEQLDNMEHNIKKFVPVGLVGRVNVKVKGKIKKGDPIVTSDIEGVGQKMEEFIPCTIIGKSLENKNTDDISKIKILISTM